MVSFEDPLLLLLSLSSHRCYPLCSSYRSPVDSRLVLVNLRSVLFKLLHAFLKHLEHIILLIDLIAPWLESFTIPKNKVAWQIIFFILTQTICRPISTIPLCHIIIDISVVVINLHRWLPFVQPLPISFHNFVIPVNLHLLELLDHWYHLFLRELVCVLE